MIKNQLIIFLTLFAINLAIVQKDPLFLLTTIFSIFCTLTIDAIICFLKERRLVINNSPVISGLIIGYVLSSDQPWWAFLLASLLAMSSKHLMRFSGKPIFNPAGLGIFLTILFLNITTEWKGTYLWYVMVPFGIYFAYRVRRMEVIYGYFLGFLVLFATQSVLQKTPFVNIFGYISYFFVFIMLIEPKTTPATRIGKWIFGIGAIVLIFILTEIGLKFDVELCVLLIMNLAAPLLNKLSKKGA